MRLRTGDDDDDDLAPVTWDSAGSVAPDKSIDQSEQSINNINQSEQSINNIDQ